MGYISNLPTMKKVGFLINPISGMGGSVGLKGTDGDETLNKAIELGAEPVAEERAVKALNFLRERGFKIELITCSGVMGEDALKKVGYEPSGYRIVCTTQEKTTSEDTKAACENFIKEDIELLIFCGGDGTARDIFEVVGQKKPIIGIPAGVKMHSAVFGVNPRSAAEAVMEYLKGELDVKESEIMDTDEEKYRMGELQVKLIGYALTPYRKTLVQAGKGVYASVDEEISKKAIADYVTEIISESTDTYILGAGTTVKAIADKLGLEKTLLGVDVVRKGDLIVKDANEKKLLELFESAEDVKIIVSPIGAQGFIFGRGNQQISAKVLKKVGIDNVMIVATPYKLSQTEILRVDTGDEELDNVFLGFRKIITGYHEMQVKMIYI